MHVPGIIGEQLKGYVPVTSEADVTFFTPGPNSTGLIAGVPYGSLSSPYTALLSPAQDRVPPISVIYTIPSTTTFWYVSLQTHWPLMFLRFVMSLFNRFL